MATATKKRRRSSAIPPSPDDVVLHEGWCVKESGTAFLGKTNWRRRWFRLVQRKDATTLQYFRGKNDSLPAGSVTLDITYCTRPVESGEKPHPNCFAVGPLVDNGSIRTYYISCSSQQSMQEWMAVVDAAIQGVPEQAQRRRDTITHKFSLRKKTPQPTLNSIGEEEDEEMSASYSAATPHPDIQTLSSAKAPDMGVSVDPTGVQHEEVSDDELWESVEDEVSDDEEGVSSKSRGREESMTPESRLSPASRLQLYEDQRWRMEHWMELCHIVKTAKWKKVDTHDGVTVARCKFGRGSGGHAVVKVEGVLAADPPTVYQFLQLTTKEGGKLDYIFRNENLLDELESEPKGTIIYNQFHPPLPRISKRDLIAMKLWVPEYLSQDGKSGFVMFSVDHPEAPAPQKDSRRMHINSSGVILSAHPGPGNTIHTRAVILMQVAFFGALHRMLKGAYNSGLLKLGLRTTFTHISEQLQRFVELINM